MRAKWMVGLVVVKAVGERVYERFEFIGDDHRLTHATPTALAPGRPGRRPEPSRHGAVSDNLPWQSGLLRLVESQLSISEIPLHYSRFHLRAV
jgi:hypothetical protein